MTILFLLPLLGGCSIRDTPCLVIFGGESKEVLALLPLNSREPFTLEFINSIYHAPVRETLTWESSGDLYIVMVESPSEAVFQYYGLEPDPSGRVLLHRKIEEVRLRSSDYTNHRISSGKGILNLKGIVPDGESANLSVRFDSSCKDWISSTHLVVSPGPDFAIPCVK
jgi:hypothetical protein